MGLKVALNAWDSMETAEVVTEPRKGVQGILPASPTSQGSSANYNLMWLLALVFILNTAEWVTMNPQTFYLNIVFQLDAAQTGMLISLMGGVGVLAQVVGAKTLTRTLGPRNVIILVTLVMAVTAIVMSATRSIVVFIIAMIANSIWFLATPMYYQLAGECTEGDESNTMFSAIATIRALSQLTGKLLGGWVLAFFTTGLGAPLQFPGFFFLVSASLSLLASTVATFFLRNRDYASPMWVLYSNNWQRRVKPSK